MTRAPILNAFVLAGGAAFAQLPGTPVPVTVDNFPRAETDMYFGNAIKDSGGIGKFVHRREVMSVDSQTVIRSNRDTLYSSAVFDLDAGPVTVKVPDAGTRFRSLMVVNQDHYVGCRWVLQDPVRWLRWEDPELPADRGGLELHGASISPAHGNPERQLEVSEGATRQLTSTRECAHVTPAPPRA